MSPPVASSPSSLPPQTALSPSVHWHAVSPHTRPLLLTILELTPLALTLSLSLAPPPPSPAPTPVSHIVHSPHAHGHHAHSQSHSHGHGHNHGQSSHRRKRKGKRGDSDDEETGAGDDNDPSTSASISPGPSSYLDDFGTTTFKDLLSHGVVVSVNGQSWKRIVAHVSEDPGDASGATSGEDGAEIDDDWEDDERDGDEEIGMSTGASGAGTGTGTRRRKTGAAAAGNIVVTPAKGDKVRRRKWKDRRWGKDKAIVVVYDLDPGREYEIELRVVGMTSDFGDAIVSNTVLVPPSPSPASSLHPRSRANSLRSRSRPRSRSNSLNAHPPSPLGDSRILHPSSNAASSSTSTSTSLSTPGGIAVAGAGMSSVLTSELPIPTNILSPVDVQTAQVRHALAAAHAEKEHMQVRIKDARKNAQRGEAALRAEIEAAKRASEKAGSTDLRAKQKTLALQEQVKQGWAGAENADKEAVEVEAGLPDLEKRLERLHGESESVRAEWKAVKEREEDVRETDKKSRAEEDKRLSELVAKLDKLRAKKEKREAEQAELERRLDELEREREEAERKGEEERMRRAGAYFGGVGGVGAAGRWDEHMYDQPHVASQRTLSAHPSLNNLSHGYSAGGNQGGGGGAPFRGRGGYRHPAGGGRHASQPSPTHTGGFYPISHPVPPVPAQYRAQKQHSAPTTHAHHAGHGTSNSSAASTQAQASHLAIPSSPSAQVPSNRAVSVGANPAAVPFHPGGSSAGVLPDTAQHTTLMPPQMQHRIYLPTVRPRAAQPFHPTTTTGADSTPPPGSGANSSNASAPSSSAPSLSPRLKADPPGLSPPAFPPLPGSTGASPSAAPPSGPSLASIVTRAVLSPTSALAPHNLRSTNGGSTSPTSLSPVSVTHGLGALPTGPSSAASATGSGTAPTSPHSPQPYASLPSPTSSVSGLANSPHAQKVTFAPPPDKEFPSLAAGGVWAAAAGRNVSGPAWAGASAGTGAAQGAVAGAVAGAGAIGTGRRGSESNLNPPEST